MSHTDTKIAPSILSADFGRLAEEVRAVDEAGADWIHVDAMDGHFVPNLTIGPPVVEAVRRATALPLDVHLMLAAPDALLEAFVGAGADLVTVHAEAVHHLHRTVHAIKELGVRAGVALNPHTSLEVLDVLLPDLDCVLLMTVNPGFGGQSYIEAVEPKIRRLRERVTREGLSVDIEVDGGIKAANIARVAGVGANVFVAGSAVFGSSDYRATLSAMRKALRGVAQSGSAHGSGP